MHHFEQVGEVVPRPPERQLQRNSEQMHLADGT